MQAFYSEIDTNQASPAGAAPWNIPIWLYVITDGHGYSAHQQNFAPQQMISATNALFTNGMGFYICGVSYLDNADWYDLSYQDGNEIDSLNHYIETHNSEYAKGFIPVILTHLLTPGFPAGFAGFPNPNKVYGQNGFVIITNQDAASLAHELGHYFFLSHTHAGGYIADTLFPQYAQYVDDTVTLNNITYTCWQTGDFLCDTKADAGGPVQPCLTDVHSCTTPVCSVTDPLDKTYTPDQTNLMSYYLNCRDRFTPQQYVVMNWAYLFNSAWSFLSDPETPNCQEVPNDRGYVYRPCDWRTEVGDLPINEDMIALRDSNGNLCGNPQWTITDVNGRYLAFHCLYPNFTGDLLIQPDKDYKNNYLNGVSTFDIASINAHILGIQNRVFTSPYQYIAADVNNSGTVSSFDMFLIKKLILGLADTFPAGSWRYVPDLCTQSQSFADVFYGTYATPQNPWDPFAAVWTDPKNNERHYGADTLLNIPNTFSWMDHLTLTPAEPYARSVESWNFWGVKVGDVNCNSDINLPSSPYGIGEFAVSDHNLLPDSAVFYLIVWSDTTGGDVPVSAWQLGIRTDSAALEILDVQSDDFPGFSPEFYHYSESEGQGRLRALWYDSLNNAVSQAGRNFLVVKARARQPISDISPYFELDSMLLPACIFDENGNPAVKTPLHLSVSATPSWPRSKTPAPAADEPFRFLSVHPDPFKNELIFQFDAAQPGEVQIVLFDLMGRPVYSGTVSYLSGANRLKINGMDRVPAGFCAYQLRTGGWSRWGKVLKQ